MTRRARLLVTEGESADSRTCTTTAVSAEQRALRIAGNRGLQPRPSRRCHPGRRRARRSGGSNPDRRRPPPAAGTFGAPWSAGAGSHRRRGGAPLSAICAGLVLTAGLLSSIQWLDRTRGCLRSAHFLLGFEARRDQVHVRVVSIRSVGASTPCGCSKRSARIGRFYVDAPLRPDRHPRPLTGRRRHRTAATTAGYARTRAPRRPSTPYRRVLAASASTPDFLTHDCHAVKGDPGALLAPSTWSRSTHDGSVAVNELEPAAV